MKPSLSAWREPGHTAASTGQRVAFWAGVALVLSAPLIRGGNRGVALIGLEWLGLVVLLGVALAWAQGERSAWGTGPTRWGLLVLGAAPLWVGLWQLAPLPARLWLALPERAYYQAVLDGLGLTAPAWRAASLTPDITWVSVLAGIPVVACLALGLTCTRDQMKTLTRVWIAAALLQALWGLAQLGPSKALHFESTFGGVIGSFANANHLAGFLAMTLPLVVLEWRRAVDGEPGRPRGGSGAWLWGMVLFVFVLAVLAGQSRAGLATALLVSLGTMLLLPGRKAHGTGWRWRMGALALVLLAALATVGTRSLHKFGSAVLASDTSVRQEMLTTTWEAARAFWPWGSGLGSFAAVYPRFQPAHTGSLFVEHAHSDYVQLLMETGVLGLLLATLALALALAQARRLGRRLSGGAPPRTEEQTMVAAGLGVLALLLHAWVDFNMRIPALAMLAAFLFGVFMRPRGQANREAL